MLGAAELVKRGGVTIRVHRQQQQQQQQASWEKP